jgi:hypothetical protein
MRIIPFSARSMDNEECPSTGKEENAVDVLHPKRWKED